MKDQTRKDFDDAKLAYETTTAIYASNGSVNNHENMLKAKKQLETARRKAFQFWVTGDPPLL